MLRTSVLRASRLAVSASPSSTLRAVTAVQSRSASHAVSNVTLADIEKRWEGMPPSEQADLWMSLRDRMKGSWSELTVQEKKACRLLINVIKAKISSLTCPSLLDRIRTSRPPRSPPSGREQESLLVHLHWHRRFLHRLLWHSYSCQATTKDPDQGMAGGVERALERAEG